MPTLVSHGDELCTGDVDYQRYRARMRDPATHHVDVDGTPRVRIVQPDWCETARYLEVDDRGARVCEVT